MWKEHKKYKKDLLKLSFYNNEYVSIQEIYSMPYQERYIMVNLLKDIYDEIEKRYKK